MTCARSRLCLKTSRQRGKRRPSGTQRNSSRARRPAHRREVKQRSKTERSPAFRTRDRSLSLRRAGAELVRRGATAGRLRLVFRPAGSVLYLYGTLLRVYGLRYSVHYTRCPRSRPTRRAPACPRPGIKSPPDPLLVAGASISEGSTPFPREPACAANRRRGPVAGGRQRPRLGPDCVGGSGGTFGQKTLPPSWNELSSGTQKPLFNQGGAAPGVASTSTSQYLRRSPNPSGPSAEQKAAEAAAARAKFDPATISANRTSAPRPPGRVPCGSIAISLCYAAKYYCHAVICRDCYGIPA
jgi:hypothetical protein